MSDSNSNATKKATTALCMEVLISKRFIAGSQNLLGLLSVYSLENQPVRKNRAIHNSEIFHFMVFDWERTVKNLLERNKVPYSIIQFFTPDSVYSETQQPQPAIEGDELNFLLAADALEETELRTMAPFQKSDKEQTADSKL